MLSIVEAAGWPIWTLIVASILSVAIIIERFISLRTSEVAPAGLLDKTLQAWKQQGSNAEMLDLLAKSSPLGRIFSAALRNARNSREVMKEAVEEAGRAAVHDLERFLPALGTIASVAPLLGLLGTVIGMVEIFGSQTSTGSNPAVLAHGISTALYNTAFGLIVAIPSLIFYRLFRMRVDTLIIEMEQEAIKLIEMLNGQRN